MGDFRILPLGMTGLRIEDPPTYWAAAFFILVALVGFLAFSGSISARLRPSDQVRSFNDSKRSVRELGRGWKMPVGSMLLTLAAGYFAWALLQTSSITFDRQAGTYVIDGGRPFFVANLQSGQLKDVAYATLETDTAGQRFALVLQDGQRMGLGSFNDKGGQSEAVAAVNRFLHVEETTHE
jgi:hypothetical protein